MAVTVTQTKPAGIQDFAVSNKKFRIRDITLNTGTYVTGGNTITAASVGLKRIDIVLFGTSVMTGGAAGVSGLGIGVTYPAAGTSVVFQQYEAAASAAPFLEKDSAEATVANATFRVLFVGF